MLYGLTLENLPEYITEQEKTIAGKRKALGENVVSEDWKIKNVDSLLARLQNIAGEEAQLEVLKTLQQYATYRENHPEKNATLEDLYAELVQTYALPGADDGWSGNGNDLKRVIFRAKLELLRDLKYVLRTKEA